MSDRLTPERQAMLDRIRDEVREAVLEGDAQDCSSADCIADAVYEIVRVATRDAERAAQGGLREVADAIFPSFGWAGVRHTSRCNHIVFPGSNGPDPEPPDPCNCGGPEVFAALAAQPTPTLNAERLDAADLASHLIGNYLWNEDGESEDWLIQAHDALVKAGASHDRGLALAARLSNVTAPEPTADA